MGDFVRLVRRFSPDGSVASGVWKEGSRRRIAFTLPAKPREGGIVRSRLWTVIFEELPRPLRQVGTEISQIASWSDRTAARAVSGAKESPGWYLVMMAGVVTILLTTLLFSPYVAQHDGRLQTLAIEGAAAVQATRQSLEATGAWEVQDRWRLAHMFVNHRPPRRAAVARIDSRLILDDELAAANPFESHLNVDQQASSRLDRDATLGDRMAQSHREARRDPEVRLDLYAPSLAAQDDRLIQERLVRDTASDDRRYANRSLYKARDERLLVQAEWSKLAECYEEIRPRSPLTRRPIPMPRPVEEEPLPVFEDDRRPEIAWELELVREFLPVTGEFPPGSRSFVESVHSELRPLNELAHRSSPLDRRPDEWFLATSQFERPAPVEAYISRVGSHAESLDEAAILQLQEEESRLPSFAEVALKLELDVPRRSLVGQTTESSLLVRNEGRNPLSLIRVRESLDELETLTDANPPARVDRDMLERELVKLGKGNEKRLGVTWVPSEEGSRIHRALVSIHAAVSTTTEVVRPDEKVEPKPFIDPSAKPSSFLEDAPPDPPAPRPMPPQPMNPDMSLDVKHIQQIEIQGMVELDILVRNTGDTPLNDVVIHVDVPDQFKHRAGANVESPIGNLPVKGEKRVVLRMEAQSVGLGTSQIRVTSHEDVEATSKAPITVVEKPVAKPVPTPKPVTKVVPKPQPKPAPKPVVVKSTPAPKPAPTREASTCCCPQPSVFVDDSWLEFDEGF